MSTQRSIENRRSAYRVQPESVYELDLAILEKRYRVVRGKVADVAIGGAQAQFDIDALEIPGEGERIMLALASERYNFDRTLWARVVASDNAEMARTLSFAFEDDNEPLAPGSEQFFALFNRRASCRHGVTPDDTGLTAIIAPRAAGASVTDGFAATLDDISAAGFSILVPSRADQALADHDELILSLTLPGHAAPRAIPCRVRHRSCQGEVSRYGCAFEWSTDAGSEAYAEMLAGYVRGRLARDARLAPDRRKPAR